MSSAQVIAGLFLALLFATYATADLSWYCGEKYCFASDYQTKTAFSLKEADGICRSLDSSSWLLEVYDEKVQNDLKKFFEGHKQLQSFSVLLNLIRKGGEWMWLDNTRFNDSLSHSNYKVKLFNNNPFATLRNLPFRGIYGLTYVTTLLKDHICSFEGSCSKRVVNGVQSLTYKGKCYVSYEGQTGLNWFEAENHCFKENGSLAVFSKFSSEELNQAFKTFAKPMENYWVGLVKHTWEWMHNAASISNYTNWYMGYPYPPLMSVPAENVFTVFDYLNGGIWTDMAVAPVGPIVCMKEKQSFPIGVKITNKREISLTTATPNPNTSPTAREPVLNSNMYTTESLIKD